MSESTGSKERAHQVAILCALVFQFSKSENKEEKELLSERIEIQREILLEGDAIVKGFSRVEKSLKGNPLDIIAAANTNPTITVRRGFYGSKNSGEAVFKYPFGAVKIILKHIDGESKYFKITDDDLRQIPLIVRDYWPTETKGEKNSTGARREWRVKHNDRLLVLVTEKENKRFVDSGFETVITFFVQNPAKERFFKAMSQKK